MQIIRKHSNFIVHILKLVIYFFFSKVVIFSIYISNLSKNNILYTNHFGFGDYLFFCVSIRRKINSRKKIFCYSKLQYDTAKFFFEKKYIFNSFILMPRFMSESHLGYHFLNKEKIFKPINPKRVILKNIKVSISDFYSGTSDSIAFIKKRINNSQISNKIIEVTKHPTICLFIKNFSKNENNHINFQTRQTRNLNKIERLIYFLNNKKINVIILGTTRDHFIQLFLKKINKKIFKNIFFFKDLSDNYSISDQAYLALNSIGYIGSASGSMGFFGLLNKKVILVDAVFYHVDKHWKNFIFLYKKIYNKNNKVLKKFIWKKYYNPATYKVVETNYREIKEALVKNFLIN